MSHPKLSLREKAGMWSTIHAAIIAGWPATLRLILVLVVIAALLCVIVMFTHQTASPVGTLLHLLVPYLPTPKPL